MQVFQQFLNLLYPQTCSACDTPLLKAEKIVCSACLIQLPKTNIGFSNSQSLENRFNGKVHIKAVYSYLKYTKGGNTQNLLHNLKYKNRQDIGVFMGNLFGTQLIKTNGYQGVDLLVAVPLFYKKQIIRGFNQSDLIAKGLSETLNVPHETNIVLRAKATDTQTRKSRIDRYQNVDNVFLVENPDKILGKSIGLVDDVLTTGATMEVCASCLLAAGAKDVSIFSLASAI
jgi:ComF family protein